MSEWSRQRDLRVRAARDEVLALFGGLRASRPEKDALEAILSRLHAAGTKAGPNPAELNQRAYAKAWHMNGKKPTKAEVEAMRAALFAPLGSGERVIQ